MGLKVKGVGWDSRDREYGLGDVQDGKGVSGLMEAFFDLSDEKGISDLMVAFFELRDGKGVSGKGGRGRYSGKEGRGRRWGKMVGEDGRV